MSSLPDPPAPFPRLYAILDADTIQARRIDPLALATAWLDAGVSLIQLRAKSLTLGPMVELAGGLVSLAAVRNALVIVNDRADVAVLAGAHGVHVGQEDLPPAAVRRVFGHAKRTLVGLSTHTAEQLKRALDEPIDYVAIGPIFPTGTKFSAWPEVGVSGVLEAAAVVDGRMPLVAIGGITLARASAVIEAGASAVAVIADLMTGNPAERAAEYLRQLP